MERFIPASEIRNEIYILNSRFIATLAPVFSVQDAKKFIARIENEFPDASHNVPAFLIGHESSVIAHCSDDGEPSGTAGRPVLTVLTGSGLGNVAVVVTRYFGGKKLGKGGLIHAYSDAAKAVIDTVPKALMVRTNTLMMSLPYPLFERVRSIIIEYNGEILEEIFSSEVTITARFPCEKVQDMQVHIQNLTRGKLILLLIEENETIMPLPK